MRAKYFYQLLLIKNGASYKQYFMEISYNQMYEKEPCHPYQTEEMKAAFLAYLGDGKAILEILRDNDFPVANEQNMSEDKIWLVTHFLGDKTNRLFAVACCRNIWHLMSDIDKQTVEIAERFSHGNATEKELTSARIAARIAAKASARIAARIAARDAARDTARDAQIRLLIETIEKHGF